MLSFQQKKASFQISYALAMIDSLKRDAKPKSALWNRLNQCEDGLGKAMDFYRIQHFNRHDLDRASRLFDVLDREIARLYPTETSRKTYRRMARNGRLRAR